MTQILIKRGTAAQWTASTRPLDSGELGLDTTNNILKAGNGTSLWNSLSGLTLTEAQVKELAQDTVYSALDNQAHQNIIVTYDDISNKIIFSTGPDVVTTTSLSNTLTDPGTGYVPISAVGNTDGVAPLEGMYVPDLYLNSNIVRTTDSQTLTNKTIGNSGLGFNSGANNSSIYTEGNDMSVYANNNLYLNANNDVIIQPGTGKVASVKGDVIVTQNGLQTLTNKTLTSASLSSPTLTGTPIAPTASSGTNTTQIATTAFVSNAISGLINSAPAALDTLNELAAALNNDSSFSTTITNSLASKLDISTASSTYAPINNPTFTGTSIYATTATITAAQFVKPSGTSSQFLKADGSSDSTVYATPTDVLNDNLNTYVTDSGTSRTLASNDKYKVIEMTSSSSISVIMPNDPTDSIFPIGTWIEIRQMGTGQITFSATSPATVVATDNQLKTRVRYASVVVEKRSSNSWYLAGDTTA